MRKFFNSFISFLLIITFSSYLWADTYKVNNITLAPESRLEAGGFRDLWNDKYRQIVDVVQDGNLILQSPPYIPNEITFGGKRKLSDIPDTSHEKKFLTLTLEEVVNRVLGKAGLTDKVQVLRGAINAEPGQLAAIETNPYEGTITIDPRFEEDLADIREHDIIFRYYFPDGKSRYVSLLQGIQHFAAMHEARWQGKEGGHLYLDQSGDLAFDKSEETTNMVGKRYRVLMAAMWLWYEHSYVAGAFNERLRYSTLEFTKRLDYIFDRDTEISKSWRSEFPFLLGDENKRDLELAKQIALWINYQFFVEPWKDWLRTNKDKPLSEYEKHRLSSAAVMKKEEEIVTLRTPGIPPLKYGDANYNYILANQIKAKHSEPVKPEALRQITNVITNLMPDNDDISLIAELLTEIVKHGDYTERPLRNTGYEGQTFKSLDIKLVDLGEKTYFSGEDAKYRYYEVTVYDPDTKKLTVYLTKAFYDKYFPLERNIITQAILHPLLESTAGLSHQEAVLILSRFNAPMTAPGKGKVVLSDLHKAILTEIKEDANNGDQNAIAYLNSLLNPVMNITEDQVEALINSGRTPEKIGEIRVLYEETARQINTFIRGSTAHIYVPASRNRINLLTGLKASAMPPDDILNEYSLSANATIAAAIAVVADGYRGKINELTEKAEVEILKDGADVLAKREIQVAFEQSGYRIVVTVSEGGLRDEVESLEGGEVIGERGFQIRSIAIDVIENTNAAARNTHGGTSIAVVSNEEVNISDSEIARLRSKDNDVDKVLTNIAANNIGGLVPDVYANIVVTNVPGEKAGEFEKNPIDPDLPVGLILQRIAEANGVEINNLEVIIIGRNREEERLKTLKKIAVDYIWDKHLADRFEVDEETRGSIGVANHIRALITRVVVTRYLAKVEGYSKEFKMSEEDSRFLSSINQTLDDNIILKKSVEIIESLENSLDAFSIKVIQDGTYIPGLKAAMGVQKGRIPVLLSTSGAPEAFMNLIAAKIFRISGAVASLKLMSNKALKGVRALKTGYDFADREKDIIRELRDSEFEGDARPNDSEEIFAGTKIFTTSHITSENLEGAVTFITDNNTFEQPGIVREGNAYTVATLRTRLNDGNTYAWVEERTYNVSSDKVTYVEPSLETVRAGGARRLDLSVEGEDIIPELLSTTDGAVRKSAPLDDNTIANIEKVTRAISGPTQNMETANQIDNDKIVVLLNKNLADLANTNNPVLKDLYRVMLQNIRKAYNDNNGIVEIENSNELVKATNEFLSQGYKVIALDMDNLFNGSADKIDQTLKDNYVTIDAKVVGLDKDEFQFLNLYSFVKLGLAVLYKDKRLFDLAFLAATGKYPPRDREEYITDNGRTIKILPVIVKYGVDDLDVEGKLKRLFAVAA